MSARRLLRPLGRARKAPLPPGAQMSPLAIVLALAAAAGAAPAPTPKPAAKASPRAAPVEAPWTEDERAFCAAELDGLARRTHLFEVQGLARAEIARRNADASDRVGECRQCFVVEQRRRHSRGRRSRA